MTRFSTKKKSDQESNPLLQSCQLCEKSENQLFINGYPICSDCLHSYFEICVRCQYYSPLESMKHVQVDYSRRAVCPTCREELEKRGCTQCGAKMQWQNAFISSSCESCGGLGYKEYLKMQDEVYWSAQQDNQNLYSANVRDWMFWSEEKNKI